MYLLCIKMPLAFKRLNACGVFCMTLTKHRIFAALSAVMLLLLFFLTCYINPVSYASISAALNPSNSLRG